VYPLVETETRSNDIQITNYDTQKDFGKEWEFDSRMGTKINSIPGMGIGFAAREWEGSGTKTPVS